MERKITIVDSSLSKQVELNTNATTLGELKAAARAAGIRIDNKDWYEGITARTFVDDNTVLPTHVTYKGVVTTDLAFLLTTSNKKTESGSERSDLYEVIKAEKLGDMIKEVFGKSFTNVKTADLKSFVGQRRTVAENKDTYKLRYEKLLHDVSDFCMYILQSYPQELKLEDSDFKEMFKNVI